MVAVYGVAARPAIEVSSTTETVGVRQGLNQGQQPLNAAPGTEKAPASYTVGGYPDSASGANPSGDNAYDNAFLDHINFTGTDIHTNVFSMIHSQLSNNSPAQRPIQNQVSGSLIPTGYKAAKGISASASVSSKSV